MYQLRPSLEPGQGSSQFFQQPLPLELKKQKWKVGLPDQKLQGGTPYGYLDLCWEESLWGPHESPHGPYSDLSEDVGSWCWALKGDTATGTSTSEAVKRDWYWESWKELGWFVPLSSVAITLCVGNEPRVKFLPPTPRLLPEFLIGFIETEPSSKGVWENITRKPGPMEQHIEGWAWRPETTSK